jgi:hypothetical protein
MPWSGVALFKFLKCFNGPFLKGKKKWLDGLEEETKSKVHLWWTSKTRVNPNKKDVAFKHIGLSNMINILPIIFYLKAK